MMCCYMKTGKNDALLYEDIGRNVLLCEHSGRNDVLLYEDR